MISGRYMKKKTDYRAIARDCASIARKKKAARIVVLDVRKLTPFVDYYVVCSGRSNIHVGSVAEEIIAELKKSGIIPAHREGLGLAQWVLLDYSGVIVHVFKEDMRKYYKVEELWSAAKKVEWKRKK